MQRRPRRMNTRPRNPRAARNPAYQIRPRYQLAPDKQEGHTEQWEAPAATTDDSEWRRPTTPIESDDPEATSYQPEVPDATRSEETIEAPTVAAAPVATIDDEPEPDTSADEPIDSEDDEQVAESEEPSEATEIQDETPEEVDLGVTAQVETVGDVSDDEFDDFSAYVRKIEEAAARSRAERHGPALVAHRPLTATAQHPAVTVTPHQTPAVRKRRPQRRHPATSGKGGGRRGGGGRPVAEKPFFKRRKTWLIALALLILIPLLAGVLYAANILRLGINAWGDIYTPPEDRTRYQVNAMGTPEAIPEEEAQAALPDWSRDDVVNIVLMGVDVQSEDGSMRSDTIIVVNVDPSTDEISMMSIPRDLLVYIPGFGDEKMNAAFALGHANQDTIPGGGPTLVAQTIEANFNIPIHYYATVDFEGFQRIVDTVGGVVVDVPAQLSDNLYPTEDLRLTRIYFGSGLQHLDGKEALQYVRTRHADSDLARGQRQQQVLLAIRERAVVRDLITKAPELIEELSDTVRTDLDFNQLLALANLGRGIDPANIARIDLWQHGILTEHFPEFEGDAYYLEADWPRVWELQAQYFDVPEPVATPTSEAVAAEPTTTPEATDEPVETPVATSTEPDLDTPVMVENGTDVEMLAGVTTQFLFDSGFTHVWPSDAEEPAAATVVYDSSGNPRTAEHICELLGLDPRVIVQREGNGDIIVLIGDDFPRPDDPSADNEEESDTP